MITLKQAQGGDKALLWNLLQKYLYEMTKYYPDDMGADGNYSYRYFDAYFVEPEREACLIYDDDILVGFAMINPHSYLGHHPDHVIAEFTIFPAYRRRHIAMQAAQKVLDEHPGKWEIKFHELNVGAKKLWETLTARYHPAIHHVDGDETVLEFTTF